MDLIFARTHNEQEDAIQHNVRSQRVSKAINLSLVLMIAVDMMIMTLARGTFRCQLL
jgi:hypothetical protein